MLYERELKSFGGEDMRKRGMRVEALDSDGVALAIEYGRSRPGLSLPDTFALALAKSNGWTLLTGDAELRQVAEREHVACHGVLWLLDRMLEEETVSRRALHAGLQAMSSHPRCRLPRDEVQKRLKAWTDSSGSAVR